MVAGEVNILCMSGGRIVKCCFVSEMPRGGTEISFSMPRYVVRLLQTVRFDFGTGSSKSD